MEENVKEEVKEQKGLGFPGPVNQWDYYYSIGKFIFIIILVASLGVFLINQGLEYRYKAMFLGGPCGLCADLNPNQSKCIDDCFSFEKTLYPSTSGDWIDSTGACFDFNGKAIECKSNSSVRTISFNWTYSTG